MMNRTDHTPIYNLKAVVRQTGLKPDTLRAWERRYGLPNPQRTDSGHRLYSQHDVEIIKWLTERQNEGLSIGRAIDLWNQLEQEDDDPLEGGFSTPSVAAPSVTVPANVAIGVTYDATAEDQIVQLRQEWIEACLRFDEQAAEAALAQSFSLFSVETVCLSILQKALAEIGERWHQGKVTVQQEHYASALAFRRLEALLSSQPLPTRPGRVLIGCPADEEHTFIPLLLSVLLRRRGYDVVYLGANVPLRSMEPTITSTSPKLVLLTAQQLFTAASLLETARLLEKEEIPLAYGGLIFRRIPELAQRIPGHYLGDDIEHSLQSIEQLLAAPRVNHASIEVSAEYTIAHDHFRQHQAEIEADIWEQLANYDIPSRQLDTANTYMGRNIRAALTLGDMNFLGLDLIWIEELLTHYYEMPTTVVHRYLDIYRDATADHLDERGKLIIEWLSGLVQIGTESVNGEPKSMGAHFGSHRIQMNGR